MDEIVCSVCCNEINEKDTAYGITRGSVDESCYGFRIDDDTDWDVYCADCMNEIDKLLTDLRQSRT